MKIMYVRFLLLIAAFTAPVVCLTCGAGAALPSEELLQIAVAGSKNAVSMVRSARGRVKQHTWTRLQDDTVMESEHEYSLAYVGVKYKLTRDSRILRNDLPLQATDRQRKLAVKPGTTFHHQAAYDGEKATVLDVEANEQRRASIGSVEGNSRVARAHSRYWWDSNVVGHGIIDVSRTIDMAGYEKVVDHGLKYVRQEPLDGEVCILLERVFTYSVPDSASGETCTRTFRYWIDPSKGFVVPKWQDLMRGGHIASDALFVEEVARFKDYSLGLWGPTRRMRTYNTIDETSGAVRKTTETTIEYDSGFEINPSIGLEELMLKLPSGTDVDDELLGAHYVVP